MRLIDLLCVFVGRGVDASVAAWEKSDAAYAGGSVTRAAGLFVGGICGCGMGFGVSVEKIVDVFDVVKGVIEVER